MSTWSVDQKVLESCADMYLSEAATHNNPGRPLDTFQRAASVAVGRKTTRMITLLRHTLTIRNMCRYVWWPTLLGPITFFFTFFLGLGCAPGSPSLPVPIEMEVKLIREEALKHNNQHWRLIGKEENTVSTWTRWGLSLRTLLLHFITLLTLPRFAAWLYY